MPNDQLQAIDIREAYLEWTHDKALIKVGKYMSDIGFNTIINPSDFSPLDYYDPLHPNRMGLWGAVPEFAFKNIKVWDIATLSAEANMRFPGSSR